MAEEDHDKGVQMWEGWGKVRLGTGVRGNGGAGRGKEEGSEGQG